MVIPVNKYCGDEVIRKVLKKAGSKLTIYELYGLFYGCIAATNMVFPSQYIPMIFDGNEASFKSIEEANKILDNLMSLWNNLAQRKPGIDPIVFPDVKYHNTYSDLKQRIKDDYSLIKYFIKGVDVGGTEESDFSEDGIKALESLSGASVFLIKFEELLEKEKGKKDIETTSASINKLEGVAADCIARISIGLKEARTKASEKVRKLADSQKKDYQARNSKIPRNEPCPCGSGKKYKKCCGQIH